MSTTNTTTSGWIIDPTTRTVTKASIRAGEWREIADLLQCDTLDAISPRLPGMSPTSLFIDDEGLFREVKAWFTFGGYPQPLAGPALLLGFNPEDGASLSVGDDWTLERVKAATQWLDLTADQEPEPGFTFIPFPHR